MQPLDYLVCAVYFCAITWLGLRASTGRAKTSEEFLMASRSMGCCTVGFSVYAALFSGITMLGTPGYVYRYGVVTAVQQLSALAAVPITTRVFIPAFYRLRLTSGYEYLELRFDLRVRAIGSALFVLRMFSYLGTALFAPALALEAVAGVPRWLTIVVAGGVSALYTVHGGMRAVIYTDIAQFLVLWGSMLLITLIAWLNCTDREGERVDVLAVAAHGRRAGWMGQGGIFDFKFDLTSEFSFWNVVFGGIPLTMVQLSADQISIQRYLTAGSMRKAQNGLWTKLVITPIFIPLGYLCGIALWVFYHTADRQDPVSNGQVANSDEVMPFFALTELPSGLAGLLIAGILAATMSTISSGLASVSTTLITDFILRFNITGRPSTDSGMRQLSQLVTVACVGIMMASAVAVSQFGAALAEISWVLNGLCGGPLLGVFLLGLLSPTSTANGALAGILAAVAVLGWVMYAHHYARPY
eukprot:SAG31_NODE_3732_length_3940_cov_35.007550_1_plen_471_part_00